jgi:hypothetical protein
VEKLEAEVADWRELHAQVNSERNHVIAERDKAEANCRVLNAQVGVLRTVERGLRDERDEWKAKAEAKSAKRAAAVERLRNCFYTSDSDLMRAILNWGHEPHTGDDSRFALIDLLTDEPMDARLDDDRTCPIDDGTSPIAGEDSREKLEADVYRAADEMEKFTYGERFINTHKILRWLDRQAEITKRECGRPSLEYCKTCEKVSRMEKEIARQKKVMMTQAESFRKLEKQLAHGGCACPEIIEHLENGCSVAVEVDGILYERKEKPWEM